MGRTRVEKGTKKKNCGKLDDDVKRHLNLCHDRANSKMGASIYDIHAKEEHWVNHICAIMWTEGPNKYLNILSKKNLTSYMDASNSNSKAFSRIIRSVLWGTQERGEEQERTLTGQANAYGHGLGKRG